MNQQNKNRVQQRVVQQQWPACAGRQAPFRGAMLRLALMRMADATPMWTYFSKFRFQSI